MAYSARTWTAGEVVTASNMNTIRDALEYLKGNAGALTIGAALTVSGVVTATSFSGAHNAADITSGALADARLSTNVALLNGSTTFTADQTITRTGLAVVLKLANGSTNGTGKARFGLNNEAAVMTANMVINASGSDATLDDTSKAGWFMDADYYYDGFYIGRAGAGTNPRPFDLPFQLTWNGSAGALDLGVAGMVYKINGTQVVGPRGAAITAPSGGSTVDSQARTAINAIRALLTAHGLSA